MGFERKIETYESEAIKALREFKNIEEETERTLAEAKEGIRKANETIENSK